MTWYEVRGRASQNQIGAVRHLTAEAARSSMNLSYHFAGGGPQLVIVRVEVEEVDGTEETYPARWRSQA